MIRRRMRMARDRRRVVEATLIAAAFSGLPSTVHASVKQHSLRSAAAYVYDTTRAVGTLVPPGRPGFGRGVVAHLAISALCGETLGRTLPRDQSAARGPAAGFLIGVINVGVIGRSFPAISRRPRKDRHLVTVVIPRSAGMICRHADRPASGAARREHAASGRRRMTREET